MDRLSRKTERQPAKFRLFHLGFFPQRRVLKTDTTKSTPTSCVMLSACLDTGDICNCLHLPVVIIQQRDFIMAKLRLPSIVLVPTSPGASDIISFGFFGERQTRPGETGAFSSRPPPARLVRAACALARPSFWASPWRPMASSTVSYSSDFS